MLGVQGSRKGVLMAYAEGDEHREGAPYRCRVSKFRVAKLRGRESQPEYRQCLDAHLMLGIGSRYALDSKVWDIELPPPGLYQSPVTSLYRFPPVFLVLGSWRADSNVDDLSVVTCSRWRGVRPARQSEHW